MNSSFNNTSANTHQTIFNIALSRRITFSFLVTLIFPSIAGSCFVIYRVAQKKDIFKRLNNQLIFCLFIVYFIQATCDLPLTIIFLYREEVAIPTDSFCIYWYTLISTLDMCCIQLNAYLSFERYLLVFHNKFILKYQILLHYIPMIFIVAYSFPFIYFFVMFYPCENHFTYNSMACGTACFVLNPTLGTIMWVYAFIAPLFLIVVLNGLLIGRVILQKRKMMQKNIWAKNKGMVLQLLSVTGMLYISWIPISIATVVNVVNSTPLLQELHGNWLLIGLIYIAVLCSPLSATIAIPELREDIYGWLHRWQPHRVDTRTHPTGVNEAQQGDRDRNTH